MTSRYMDWYQTAKKFEINEIPYKNFSNGLTEDNEIESGSFGTVYKTECKSIGLVTIKEIDDENRSDCKEIKEIIKEVFNIKTC